MRFVNRKGVVKGFTGETLGICRPTVVRFNNRRNPYLFRDTLMKLVGAKALEYKELIAAD